MFMVEFFSHLCVEKHDVAVDGCSLLALGPLGPVFVFVNMLYTGFSSLVHNSYVPPKVTIYWLIHERHFSVLPTTGFTQLLGLQCPQW